MQIGFVVWPKTTNPRFLWGNDHGSHVWLSISLMYHFMGCAIVLMIQYLIVLRFVKSLDRYYSRYEDDLIEIEKSRRFPNDDSITTTNNNKEYAILMNDMDDNEMES